ncbi:hypothetical protein [Tenacibaculum maritimum]|uniref:hypothetical protein n=1 Tax=Tenacibaculum maritimum TaxID=107401 RepID=UPI001E2DB7BC|nr:hypothetical protein [Tenacibaculum maritimum]MCD9585114.1 hypothetical protein [Tenacibaculum maritimum]MCD9620894.1 hypothetical protein [Tenacibaculum maritimum]MCD9627295.1 hypothetical protein [Tenacibaculum maritimum]MCD9629835.1 hypothetical protein [Tenacibaculum maritimum]MCD9633020.1 hypothetical protein [Tenacibaculum maritimum]
MTKFILTITLTFLSNLIWTQNEHDISEFSPVLNQFYDVRDFCISNDGKEAFVTLQAPNGVISQIVTITKKNNKWTTPKLLPFCNTYKYLEPFLSSDGKRLFFVSDRPLTNTSTTRKDFDIWYVERADINAAWSSPVNIGKPISSNLDEFYPTLSENNNLYFTMNSPNGRGKDDIYFSKWNGTTYLPPVLLNENINSNGYEFNAFISKKEDFILFTKYNEKGGQGSGDLYISKRNSNGKWGKAVNMNTPINTKYMEYCPFYDEKRQILYFTSKRQNIAPKKFKDIADFKEYIQQHKNGLSKIYKIPIKLNR